MKASSFGLFALLLALPSFAAEPHSASKAEMSRRLTATAEELLVAERKAAKDWRDASGDSEPEAGAGGVDYVLYEDVLSLLDSALELSPANLHARTVMAQVLLLKSYQGESTYDICYLLDARDQADYVITRASSAAATDLARARTVSREIKRIPPDEIPDSPSSCDSGDDDHAPGNRT